MKIFLYFGRFFKNHIIFWFFGSQFSFYSFFKVGSAVNFMTIPLQIIKMLIFNRPFGRKLTSYSEIISGEWWEKNYLISTISKIFWEWSTLDSFEILLSPVICYSSCVMSFIVKLWPSDYDIRRTKWIIWHSSCNLRHTRIGAWLLSSYEVTICYFSQEKATKVTFSPHSVTFLSTKNCLKK